MTPKLCQVSTFTDLKASGIQRNNVVQQDMLILRKGLFFNEQEEDRRRSRRVNLEICYLTTVAVFADGHKIETMVGRLFGFPRSVEEKNLSFDVSVFVISM